jgi:hypothetical protein
VNIPSHDVWLLETFWGGWIDTSLSLTFQDRVNDLVTAIHTLNDNPIVDINNINSNESDYNKNYILSLIKVLKDIGWLAQDKNEKYIRTMKNQINDSST